MSDSASSQLSLLLYALGCGTLIFGVGFIATAFALWFPKLRPCDTCDSGKWLSNAGVMLWLTVLFSLAYTVTLPYQARKPPVPEKIMNAELAQSTLRELLRMTEEEFVFTDPNDRGFEQEASIPANELKTLIRMAQKSLGEEPNWLPPGADEDEEEEEDEEDDEE